MEIALALGAALCFALGTVLQQKGAIQSSDEEALKANFLLTLARRPVWLAGLAVDGLGFVCQAAALGIGRLVVVQPLLATSVVFALPFGAKLTNQHVGRREIIGAVAVVIGLGAFLVAADPSGGKDDASPSAWLIGGAIIVAVCTALVIAGMRARPTAKAALFGTAAGILFAVSAGLTKAVVDQLGEGVFTIFADWHLYALIVVGYVSMTLSQTSLQTGALAPAMATQMTFDPLASVLIGTLMFGETIHEDPVGLAASTVALLVMFAGLGLLARSAPADLPPAPDQVPQPAG
jgi:drug/metabolite transporter (DMT)-like permease